MTNVDRAVPTADIQLVAFNKTTVLQFGKLGDKATMELTIIYI